MDFLLRGHMVPSWNWAPFWKWGSFCDLRIAAAPKMVPALRTAPLGLPMWRLQGALARSLPEGDLGDHLWEENQPICPTAFLYSTAGRETGQKAHPNSVEKQVQSLQRHSGARWGGEKNGGGIAAYLWLDVRVGRWPSTQILFMIVGVLHQLQLQVQVICPFVQRCHNFKWSLNEQLRTAKTVRSLACMATRRQTRVKDLFAKRI